MIVYIGRFLISELWNDNAGQKRVATIDGKKKHTYTLILLINFLYIPKLINILLIRIDETIQSFASTVDIGTMEIPIFGSKIFEIYGVSCKTPRTL